MSRTASVVIRPAHEVDSIELRRLAELDSAPVLNECTLVAEMDDRIVAALGVETGARVADPFVATADVLALLELRARRSTGFAPARPRHRLTIPHVRARARAA